jgi:hypothetical protein
MHRKLILTAFASAAILCGGQALAAGGPGGGGGGGGGGPGGGGGHGGGMGDHGGGMGDMGGIGNAGGMGHDGVGDMDDMNRNGGIGRDDARINSEGPEHASPTGIAHANENSVLAGTTATNRVASGPLAGVATGMNVFSNGMLVGTVQQVRIAGNGNVALVLVKGTNGGIFPVPANKLSLANGTLSTTARFHGINDNRMEAQAREANENEAENEARDANHKRMEANENENENEAAENENEVRGRMNSQGPAHASATGIAHANQHSVLAGAAVTTTTGISVGMPLFRNGTQVGTVSRVITANGTIRRVLVQGLNGRTFSLSPSMLTASGGTLTTTAPLRGM